jgi:hypothetical protein
MSKDPALTWEPAHVSPCVKSGQCCKKAPCQFGEVTSPTNSSCRFLEVETTVTDGKETAEIHRCGRYEFIVKQPGHEFSPAFGAGCCQPMFNENRQTILRISARKAASAGAS